ncbi:hypothetical protein TrRE_jg1205 [Triparma retinervis]|uniref:Uncharacterized protein n=1 Tax=Triparma retinervis TaxID=2557542 RepID=A0A9W7FVV6_9STRA|nr:hypothetical protein TrRE_jg1205 [Triparma retinervis]
MMKVAFEALSKLEKDDPVEFDLLMTKLEDNMKEEAAKSGIDLEAAQKKADEWIKNNPDTPFPGMPGVPGANDKANPVRMPDGRTMAPGGVKVRAWGVPDGAEGVTGDEPDQLGTVPN